MPSDAAKRVGALMLTMYHLSHNQLTTVPDELWNACLLSLYAYTRLTYQELNLHLANAESLLQRHPHSDIVYPSKSPQVRGPYSQASNDSKTLSHLPNELLIRVFTYLVHDTPSLSRISSMNKRFHSLSTPILYEFPHLTSPHCIALFIKTLQQSKQSFECDRKPFSNSDTENVTQSLYPYHTYVRSVCFEPSSVGFIKSASPHPLKSIFGCDNTSSTSSLLSSEAAFGLFRIQQARAGLFTMITRDRPGSLKDMTVSHSIVSQLFYKLVELCPNLSGFEEYGPSASGRSSSPSTPHPSLTITTFKENKGWFGTWTHVKKSYKRLSTSIALSLLLRSCKRTWLANPEWKGIPLPHAIQLCVRILSIFEVGNHPFWDTCFGNEELVPSPLTAPLLSSTTRQRNRYLGIVQHLRPMFLVRCRTLLGSISTSLLLQVQFLTSSAQRMLDAYCTTYHRALAVADTINISNVFELRRGYWRVKRHLSVEDMFGEVLTWFDQDGDEPVEHNEEIHGELDIDSNYIRQRVTPDIQETAARIIEAFSILYNTKMASDPSQNDNTEVVTNLARTGSHPTLIEPTEAQLSENIRTFPGLSLTPDNIELLLHLIQLDEHLLQSDQFCTYELRKCIGWIHIVLSWYICSMEMDPIKDTLRKSMHSIDLLRSVQRKYGIVFMD